MFIVVALVMATSFPTMSHAMMTHDAAKVEKVEASGHGDCHQHGEAKAISRKTAKSDKGSSGQCCDKGVCKCVAGACHGGFATISGDSGNSLLTPSARKSTFGFSNQFTNSTLPERLKRPPKA